MKKSAFTLVELGVVLAVLAMLGLGVVLFLSRSHRGSAVQTCRSNLQQLGRAAILYSQQNDDRLPFAYVRFESKKSGDQQARYLAWDSLIYPVIHVGNHPAAGTAPEKGMPSPARVLRCPVDTIGVDPEEHTDFAGDGEAKTDPKRSKNKARRTYAMPLHSMTKQDWPPGPENATGIGLWWSDNSTKMASIANLTNGNGAALHRQEFKAPARTLLLTEQARTNNFVFHYIGAGIKGPEDHLDESFIKAAMYHQGKYNYLMVDGHVETLSPVETLGQQAKADSKLGNIWTVRSDD